MKYDLGPFIFNKTEDLYIDWKNDTEIESKDYYCEIELKFENPNEHYAMSIFKVPMSWFFLPLNGILMRLMVSKEGHCERLLLFDYNAALKCQIINGMAELSINNKKLKKVSAYKLMQETLFIGLSEIKNAICEGRCQEKSLEHFVLYQHFNLNELK